MFILVANSEESVGVDVVQTTGYSRHVIGQNGMREKWSSERLAWIGEMMCDQHHVAWV